MFLRWLGEGAALLSLLAFALVVVTVSIVMTATPFVLMWAAIYWLVFK